LNMFAPLSYSCARSALEIRAERPRIDQRLPKSSLSYLVAYVIKTIINVQAIVVA